MVALRKVQSGLDVSLVVLDWDKVTEEGCLDSFVQNGLGFRTENIDIVYLLFYSLAEQAFWLLIWLLI